MNRWDVHIPAHRVARYDVPDSHLTAPGDTPADGIYQAVQWLHADLGIPGWRPYVEESCKVARATVHFDIAEENKKNVRDRKEKRAQMKRQHTHE